MRNVLTSILPLLLLLASTCPPSTMALLQQTSLLLRKFHPPQCFPPALQMGKSDDYFQPPNLISGHRYQQGDSKSGSRSETLPTNNNHDNNFHNNQQPLQARDTINPPWSSTRPPPSESATPDAMGRMGPPPFLQQPSPNNNYDGIPPFLRQPPPANDYFGNDYYGPPPPFPDNRRQPSNMNARQSSLGGSDPESPGRSQPLDERPKSQLWNNNDNYYDSSNDPMEPRNMPPPYRGPMMAPPQGGGGGGPFGTAMPGPGPYTRPPPRTNNHPPSKTMTTNQKDSGAALVQSMFSNFDEKRNKLKEENNAMRRYPQGPNTFFATFAGDAEPPLIHSSKPQMVDRNTNQPSPSHSTTRRMDNNNNSQDPGPPSTWSNLPPRDSPPPQQHQQQQAQTQRPFQDPWATPGSNSQTVGDMSGNRMDHGSRSQNVGGPPGYRSPSAEGYRSQAVGQQPGYRSQTTVPPSIDSMPPPYRNDNMNAGYRSQQVRTMDPQRQAPPPGYQSQSLMMDGGPPGYRSQSIPPPNNNMDPYRSDPNAGYRSQSVRMNDQHGRRDAGVPPSQQGPTNGNPQGRMGQDGYRSQQVPTSDPRRGPSDPYNRRDTNMDAGYRSQQLPNMDHRRMGPGYQSQQVPSDPRGPSRTSPSQQGPGYQAVGGYRSQQTSGADMAPGSRSQSTTRMGRPQDYRQPSVEGYRSQQTGAPMGPMASGSRSQSTAGMGRPQDDRPQSVEGYRSQQTGAPMGSMASGSRSQSTGNMIGSMRPPPGYQSESAPGHRNQSMDMGPPPPGYPRGQNQQYMGPMADPSQFRPPPDYRGPMQPPMDIPRGPLDSRHPMEGYRSQSLPPNAPGSNSQTGTSMAPGYQSQDAGFRSQTVRPNNTASSRNRDTFQASVQSSYRPGAESRDVDSMGRRPMQEDRREPPTSSDTNWSSSSASRTVPPPKAPPGPYTIIRDGAPLDTSASRRPASQDPRTSPLLRDPEPQNRASSTSRSDSNSQQRMVDRVRDVSLGAIRSSSSKPTNAPPSRIEPRSTGGPYAGPGSTGDERREFTRLGSRERENFLSNANAGRGDAGRNPDLEHMTPAELKALAARLLEEKNRDPPPGYRPDGNYDGPARERGPWDDNRGDPYY